MEPLITVCIPVGPHHRDLAERAIHSVRTQTIPCDVLIAYDQDASGPGVLRNRMLQQVTTPFVIFLDADDWIEPTFASATLNAYRANPNHYIYTDWWQDGAHIPAPDAAWCYAHWRGQYQSTWHVITALLPTSWARGVGGFDETLPALEDSDFYLKLVTSQRCGVRVPMPLFNYTSSPEGIGRSKVFHHGPQNIRLAVLDTIQRRYVGLMGCCGEPPVNPPSGDRQPNDVLAQAKWGGNMRQRGRITGRIYKWAQYPDILYIDPQDVAAAPDHWRLVEDPKVPDAILPHGLDAIAQALQAEAKPIHQPAAPVTTRQDVGRITRLAAKAWDEPTTAAFHEPVATPSSSTNPMFLLPANDYPSYRDFFRLAELSGFGTTPLSQADWNNPGATIIVATPEKLPADAFTARARVVAWQLEYTGDYASNYDGWTGEVWASDKAWASEHGATYVLMGSHPKLAGGDRLEAQYDLTMLGYMVARRQKIQADLAKLKWAPDYPGHGTPERDVILRSTRLMLHVHQHDDSRYIAPQRFALAAAYKLPMIAETVTDPGPLGDVVKFADYDKLASVVRVNLKREALTGLGLHELLCKEKTFRVCVEEALE